MTFAAPQWFWALLIVPALWALLWRRGRAVESGEVEAGHARWVQVDARGARPVPPGRPASRHGVVAGFALVLGVVALAQPQWGTREEVQFDQAREVLIALDLSRSMLAQDVRPSRLGRARLLVESTLEELAGERVGLLLFAGTAFLQSPLSADHEVLREVLPVLEPGYLPQGGTDFEAMIEAALEAFSQTGAADRYLVILSDGESDAFDTAAVSALEEAGVQVIALGIGTEAGALIPDGAGGIVKDDRGAAVLSRLERSALERLATATSGIYVDAANWLDLAALVDSTVATGQTGEFVERKEARAVHRFQWWLAPAVLLLLMSHLFEFPASPRTQMLRGRRGDRDGEGAFDPARFGSTAAGLLASIGVAMGMWVGFDVGPALASEPPPAPPNPIVEVVARLAAMPEPGAADYADLASRTLEVGQAGQGAGDLLAEGVVLDALAALGVGEGLDATAADWAALRTGLEALLEHPPPSPQSDQGEGESGESGEEQGEGGESAEGSSGAEPGGQSSEGEPGDESSQPGGAEPEPASGEGESAGSDDEGSGQGGGEPDSDEEGGGSGERPEGQPQAMEDASAGLGGLGEDEGKGDEDSDANAEATEAGASEAGGEAERESPEASRPSRLVGGTPSENEQLIQDRPDLSSAVGRMERVRESDAPAVLFDRMNTAEGRMNEAGGSTW